MKLKITEILKLVSTNNYWNGVSLYDSNNIIPEKITPNLFTGVVMDHFHQYIYHIDFDENGDVTFINCNCNQFNDFNFCKHIVAACKLRQDYVDGYKLSFNEGLINQKLYEYVPYENNDEENNKYNEVTYKINHLDKNDKGFSNQICNLTLEYLNATKSFDCAKKYFDYLLSFLVENKIEKEISSLYVFLYSQTFRNSYSIKDKYIKTYLKEIKEMNLGPIFISNLTDLDIKDAWSYVYSYLKEETSSLVFASEKLLLIIAKHFKSKDTFMFDVLNVAIDLEYLELLKYFIAHCRIYFSIKQLDGIIKILKDKVDSSDYYDLYKMRIKEGKLKPQEFVFLYQYLDSDKIEEIVNTRTDLINNSIIKGFTYRSFISTWFLDYFMHPNRCDSEDMQIDEYYALKDIIFTRTDNMGKNAIKGFKKLVLKEARKAYHDDEEIYMIVKTIIANLSVPKIKEITMNESFNEMIKERSDSLSSYYVLQLSKAGLSTVGFDYSKFNK